MTDKTGGPSHAELSRDLALALGYYPEAVRILKLPGGEPINQVYWDGAWCTFDYREPSIVVPLIKWLGERKCFVTPPCPGQEGGWKLFGCQMIDCYDTPEEAVARAVISLKGGK